MVMEKHKDDEVTENKENVQMEKEPESVSVENEEVNDTPDENEAETETEQVEEEIDELEEVKNELAEMKDKYIRLYSEFENFRRRTAKERLDTIQSANGDLIEKLLPVVDDFARAEDSSKGEKADLNSVKEGYGLIAGKFNRMLEQQGLKEMEVKQGADFDAEVHEAISQIPAPKPKLKGKIIDVVEKGYLLNEKVLRFAKVVVGS